MKPVLPVLGLLAVLTLTGCAHFEYRLVQPSQFAQRIGKEPVLVREAPLDYQFAIQGDHLSARIFNPTDNTIRLLSEKSYVVDPRGGSHPIPPQVLAPHSHAAMLLPPKPTRVSSYSYVPVYPPPQWSLFFPERRGLEFGPGFYSDWPYYERYNYPYQVQTPYNWEWKTGEARLHLAYEQPGGNFEHSFVFVREKLK